MEVFGDLRAGDEIAARGTDELKAGRIRAGQTGETCIARLQGRGPSESIFSSTRSTGASDTQGGLVVSRQSATSASGACHIPKPYPVSPLETESESMKRTFAIILAALAAAALFGGLVHAVLVAAHVSEPAATTVYGLTPRRLWATTVAVVALVGVVIGGLALARPASRFGTASGRLGAIVALVAGLIAVVNGGLNLAIANGGPGTGNGVVGGAAAFVLGLIAMALGGLALARSRRTALEPGRMT